MDAERKNKEQSHAKHKRRRENSLPWEGKGEHASGGRVRVQRQGMIESGVRGRQEERKRTRRGARESLILRQCRAKEGWELGE